MTQLGEDSTGDDDDDEDSSFDDDDEDSSFDDDDEDSSFKSPTPSQLILPRLVVAFKFGF